MADAARRVLIIHDGEPHYLAGFQRRFPDLSFHLCQEGEAVRDALDRVRPEIVYALHGGRYRAFTHAPVIGTPGVKWLQNGGAGIDHVPAWDPDQIHVTNSAGLASPFMAETVAGAILMLNFGFPRHMENQRRHHWEQRLWTSLSDRTALIIGLGGIGTRVADRLRAFSMHTIGVRASDKPSDHVDEVIASENLAEGLARADFVCVHVPRTPATHHLVNAEFLAAMKNSAYLINTSRGAQLHEPALIAALNEGQIAGAYLDVFENEPLPEASPLWDTPNLIISPHVSDLAHGWERNSAGFFADNLERYLKGEPLHNMCESGRGY